MALFSWIKKKNSEKSNPFGFLSGNPPSRQQTARRFKKAAALTSEMRSLQRKLLDSEEKAANSLAGELVTDPGHGFKPRAYSEHPNPH